MTIEDMLNRYSDPIFSPIMYVAPRGEIVMIGLPLIVLVSDCW